MQTIAIKNTEARVFHFGISASKDVRLVPGLNPEVPLEDWEAAKKTQAAQALIASGTIEELEVGAGDLLKLEPKKAIALVGTTLDRDALRKWRDQESRADVKAAITAQIQKVTPVKSSTEKK